MRGNPFTLMYGTTSKSVVNREDTLEKIIRSFEEQDNMYAHIITGIRGSGKTVLLRTIEERLSNQDDWVVININPQGNIITSLANKLYDKAITNRLIGKWSLSINLEILTLTMEKGQKTNDPEIIIERMLEKYSCTNKKVLISIDEVNDTHSFREFINLYQTMIGKKYPLYLLMTALKENISTLINDKAMTFLSRTPKDELLPLDLVSVAKEYQSVLSVDLDTAANMAKLTNGYAFAYQVLGYLYYESEAKELSPKLIAEYEKYLWNNGYNKFYKDLSEVERKFVMSLALTKTGSKEEITEQGLIKKSSYTIYRERLLEKGLIVCEKYGYLSFVLPRFKEYLNLLHKLGLD